MELQAITILAGGIAGFMAYCWVVGYVIDKVQDRERRKWMR